MPRRFSMVMRAVRSLIARLKSRTKLALAIAVLLTLGTRFPLTALAAVERTTHFTVPISAVLTCGERVRVTGDFDFTSHTSENSTGGVLVAIHFRGDGIVGVGTKSGAVYRLVGAATDVTFEGESAFTSTFVHHGTLIGGDPGAEHSLMVTVHTTVNKSNDVTAGIDKSECS